MKQMKSIHVIVATGEWAQDQLRYRRHRLAEFLQNHPETKEVIWLCPTPEQKEDSYTIMSNRIKQWTIKDLFPQKVFRFGRYMDEFHRTKLQPLLLYLKEAQEKYTVNLWYTFPGFPLLTDVFSWNKIAYDCSDLWTSPINGKNSIVANFRKNIISSAENRIIQNSDVIFCTSELLRTRIVEKLGSEEKVFTFENGVEFDLFAKNPTQIANILPDHFDGTVLGFIGGIKPKLDFDLIQEAAQKKREWLFLFVGPDGTNDHPKFKDLLTESNVLWTGSVVPTEVPKYMNLIDIGIMPYKSSQYNQAVFPLKLFEFLAAGKSVVGMHLPSTKKYAEESVYAHLDNNDTNEFIRVCEQLEGTKTHPDYIRRRKTLAKTKNWNEVFEDMILLV
ncbi:teichuronic acid biosynthesis protein TuaH [Neobacillus drentensis]|uniref:teichuronic acid biosynthesis protein TuaH n=1 Tax=Neobacillus drentensis TaxID=220684 RepID=UPI003001A04B